MKTLALVLTGAGLGILVGLYFVSRSPGRASQDVGLAGNLRRDHPASLGTPITGRAQPESQGAPPRFLAKPGAALQSDPTRADYDPVRLSDLGYSMEELFKAEPRNKRWADAVEGLLEKRLVADLPAFTQEGKVAGIECRSSSCEVMVDAPFEDLHRVSFGLQYPPLGDAFSPSTDDKPIAEGWHRHTVHVLFRPESRDLGALAELDRERRRLGLKIIRDANQLVAKLGIDPSKLLPVAPSP